MITIGQQVLGRFKVTGVIDEGPVVALYRARDEALGRGVLVKLLTWPGAGVVKARFAREARILAGLGHPSIVSIHDVGVVDGAPCLVLEDVAGERLDAVLEVRRALPWPEAVALCVAVLDALAAMHAQGLVHRGITPAALMVLPGGRGVKLVDLGLAKPADDVAARVTETGRVAGIPSYMAPEQLFGGEVGALADVYALALVLYELVSGRLPYDTSALSRIIVALEAPLPPPAVPHGLPEVPGAVVSVLMSALAREPADRPASAEAFARALQVVAARSRRSTAPQLAAPPPQKR